MAVLEENEANWKALVEVAGGRDAVEKYRHCWRNVAQQTSSLVAFIYWLENRILVSKEQVEEFAKSIFRFLMWEMTTEFLMGVVFVCVFSESGWIRCRGLSYRAL